MSIRFCFVFAALAGLASCSNITQFVPASPQTLVLGEPQGLVNALHSELLKQRQNNTRLQRYSDIAKRAHYEKQLLIEMLRARGHYGADVRAIRRDKAYVYMVEPGPLYRIRKVTIDWPDDNPLSPLTVQLRAGQALEALPVLRAKKRLQSQLNATSCLYLPSIRSDIRVFHDIKKADVHFIVEKSPQVYLGNIHVLGLEKVAVDYVKEQLMVTTGDCYKREAIDQARLTLLQTGLFASITTDTQLHPDTSAVDLTFQASERPHRTLSAGLVFQSDQGGGVTLGWEHRNLLSRAQKLEFDSVIAENAQGIDSSFTIPHFGANNQQLRLFAEIERENTDAFKSQVNSIGSEFRRHFNPRLEASVGVRMDFSQVEELGAEENYSLASLPLSIQYDRRNDELDPTRGWVATAIASPFKDNTQENISFLKSTLAASAYITLDRGFRPTLAGRIAIGSISGEDREDVPANVRFLSVVAVQFAVTAFKVWDR